jgi:hypothetical protein
MALSPRRHHRQHLWIVPRAPAERAPRARFTNPLWLAFGVAGGPLAWVFSYTLTSALISPSCSMSRSIILGMPSAQVRELLIATVGALVAVSAGIVSWYIFRQVARSDEETAGGSIGQTAFWSLGGMFLSVIFVLAIAATGVASITLSGMCT